ncbi:MAG: YfhO family protein [Deltaproteobacteria bacterium]|nr:YfhO family protein [Deltaproteobacteria bacterium]
MADSRGEAFGASDAPDIPPARRASPRPQGDGRRALGFGLLGLLAVLGLAYLRVLMGGETFAVRDHLTWTLPSRAFLSESLRQGHLPEWWDHLRLGDRFAADPNNSVTYPLAWTVALVDPLVGADLLLLFHLMLAGAGALLLARRLGASPLGAFFGGAVFMTSGYMTSMVVNGSVLMALGWMPLVAWAALGIARAEERTACFRQGLLFALVLAGSVAAGNPAGTNNVALGLAIVLVCARHRALALATLAAAGCLGALMGAASLLPPLLTLPDSARAGGFALAESGVWSMHPLRLLELVWPNLMGHGLRPERNLADFWVDSGGLGGNWSASDYIGLPVLCCAGIAAWRGDSIARRLGYLSLFFLLLALGTHTLVYGAYREVFRFEHVLRYPEKHLASALLLWSVLAGVGLDRLLDPAVRRRRLARAMLGCAAFFAACVCAGYVLDGQLADLIQRAGLARKRGLDGRAALSHVLEGGLVAAAMAAFVALSLSLVGQARLGRFARPGFVILAIAQLLAHDWSTHVLIARSQIRRRPAVLAYLPIPNRVEVPRIVRRAQDATPITVSGEVRALYLHQIVDQNTGARFGFGQVPGYLIAGTKRFDVLAAASGQSNLERIMDLLDIRYLLIDAAQAGGMGMPARTPGAIAGHVVLENGARRPRAFVAYRYRHGLGDEQVLARLFAPGRSGVDLGAVHLAGAGHDELGAREAPSPCRIERPVPEHVILHCQAVRPGYAVLLDEWTRGWSATVDGSPAAIERADVVFRAVAIPAGSHRVEMCYQTPGLRAGAMLSLAGWLGFLILAGVWLKVCGSGYRPGSRPPRHDPPA